jgi:hypothetical protein
MATDAEDAQVSAAAKLLKGTPYALTYISKPTPAISKYAFQHTTVTTHADAMAVIAAARDKLTSGKAEWSSGTPFSWETHLSLHRSAVETMRAHASAESACTQAPGTPQEYRAAVVRTTSGTCCLCSQAGHDVA